MSRTCLPPPRVAVLRSALCAAFLLVSADLLRAGNPFHWPTGGASSAATATGSTSASPGSTTTPGTVGAQIWLQRSTATLQAVQAMQAAAQAAAAAAAAANNLGINPNNPGQQLPNVPDGLASPQLPSAGSTPAGPGLRVAVNAQGAPVLWLGAGAPTPAAANPNQITITQTQQQALLEWQTFDLGKNTTLDFDQSLGGANAADWIAFNFVRDPSGRPSQILGSLTTSNGSGVGGQVYVIDANGIIFGGSSQVNAGALVASSLPINAGLIQRGLLNNPDDQFLFSALPIASGNNGPTPAFDPTVAVSGAAPAQTPFDPAGSGNTGTQFAYGNVTVQAGASLTAPDSAPNVGGKVALIGPSVVNDGTITTPDGQTILAAGLQVGLAASTDPELRGLDVYIGAAAYPASYNLPSATIGTATNDGDPGAATASGTLGAVTTSSILNADGSVLVPAGTPIPGMIEAPRADVWMAGASVYQLGVIDSSTSVSYNGRIDLTANYGAVSTGGNIQNSPPYFWQATGTVTLGSGSVSQILPQLSDATTIVGASFYSLALPSEINIQGNNIGFDPADGLNPGAMLLAPNATIDVNAGTWQFLKGGFNAGTQSLEPISSQGFIYNTGDITVGNGAVIDAAGSENIDASVTENIVAVQLRGTELANSPVQRNGPLEGQTVDVDIDETGTYDGTPWVGTPLADTSGYVGLIQHTVGELTIDGGAVNFNAGGAVALESGSAVDVSGGWINYQGAYVQTTKLINQAGQIIDISQATPNVPYEGIYTGTSSTTDSKWGLSQTTADPVPLGEYQPGYTEGGNGGALSIRAPVMTLTGGLIGDTYPGAYQVNPASMPSALQASLANAGIDPRVWGLSSLPNPAELSLTFETQYANSYAPDTYDWYEPAPPDIIFQPGDAAAPAGALILSPDLVDSNIAGYGGFGKLVIDDSADNDQLGSGGSIVTPANPAYGGITVAANPASPDNVTLQTAPGGSIIFDAANIDIEGGVVAPGGTLQFTAHDFSPDNDYSISNGGVIPNYDPAAGNFTLAAEAGLSVAGLVLNEEADSSSGGPGPLLTTGGSIAIAGSSVSLESGSTVRAGGGAVINTSAQVIYGAAGSISLKTGADPAFPSILTPADVLADRPIFDADDETNLPGNLKPLDGFSGAAGGSLSVVAPLVQIGTLAGATPPDGTLVLNPEFFDNGGFASFTIDGVGRAETDSSGNVLTDGSGNEVFYPALYVTPGTQIYPRVQQLQIVPDDAGYEWSILAPFAYQVTPVNLTFGATGVANPTPSGTGAKSYLAEGNLIVGAGAGIETDPQTDAADGIALSGQTVAMLGELVAPGGTISISGSKDSTTLFTEPSGPVPTVDLGPDSLLSTAGTTVLKSDAFGNVPGAPGYLPSGSVLPGGAITLSGNIAAEAGSVINVSGASAVLDLPPTSSGNTLSEALSPEALTFSPTLVASNAGSIAFVGQQELFIDSALEGLPGGPTATGGSLSISSGAFGDNTAITPTLSVVESGPTLPSPFYGLGQTAIGHPVVDGMGNPLPGMGYFAVSSLNDSGLASLALDGTVEFQGPVSIAVAESLIVAGEGPTGGGGGIISADGAVSLAAPYVALGQPYLAPSLPGFEPPAYTFSGNPSYFLPASGSGTLTVTAGTAAAPGLIDVGNLSLQQIGQANLTAAGGDVRGFGTVDIAGDLAIAAGQIYAPTEETFTLAAYNYNLPSDPAGAAARPGTISIVASGSRQIPLSAGSTLNLYASAIDQDGVLQAPAGTIDLGWNGSGSAPIDPITNAAVPVTQSLSLGPNSVTSVSGALVDPISGQVLPIPYGLIYEDNSWIDPSGANITTSGPPPKSISLSAANVSVASGATIDTAGGGDLFAYEFVPGTGGTSDILGATSQSFAVIPGYEASYAPYASYNPAASTNTVTNYASGDLGYTSVNASGNSQLAVGEQVYLNLQNGLGSQAYTLLPARYALLPGAYLVTPLGSASIAPAQATAQPDGSSVVTGYTFNAFDPSRPSVYGEFDVALGTPATAAAASSPTSVVRNRALYTDYFANSFFAAGEQGAGPAVVPLPADGGDLGISATTTLTVQGAVTAQPATGGEGGLVDITSPENIVINDAGNGGSNPAPDTLYLSATGLSDFGAGSLLIGGTRTGAGTEAAVDVTAGTVTVDNPGDPLTGTDIILVANQNLTVAPGSEVEATGAGSASAESLLLTDSLQLQPAATAAAAGQASTISLSQGGTTLSLPQGTPTGDTIAFTVNGTITLANGSTVTLTKGSSTAVPAGSTVTLSGPGEIIALGTGAPVPVTLGDGVLLRVSDDGSASSTRIGVASSTAPTLQIGAGATISGAGVTIDSTNSTVVDPTASLSGAISLSSGQISLVLDNSLAGDVGPGSLVLTGSALSSLETNATALSLLSYSSIDTYGAGQIGAPAFTNLSLGAGEIRGFDLGADGQVTFAAQTIALSNSPGAANPGPASGTTLAGTLAFDANTIDLGSNALAIDQFANVNLTAGGGILAEGSNGSTRGSGHLAVAGNLTMTAPLLTATAGTDYGISADGKLAVDAPASGTSSVSGGLGAQMALTGSSVAVNGTIALPSGQLTLTATGAAATGGNVAIGGALDAGGTFQTFDGTTEYTDGGAVNLISDNGAVAVGPGGSISVAVQPGGGSAGSLSVSAPAGTFAVASATVGQTAVPTLDALNGQGGTFSLDASNLSDTAGNATTSLSPLENALAAGGFSLSQSLRVRTGGVTADGTVKAATFNLSTDTGSIDVQGTIDASGPTGGAIELDAGGSVTLENGSILTVRGQNFNDAGEAGTVTLQAGASADGTIATGTRDPATGQFGPGAPVVDIESGSTIDLSVVNDHPLQLNPGGTGSGQAVAGGITVPAGIGVYFPDGTPGSDEIALSNGGVVTTPAGASAPFAANAVLTLVPGSTVTLNGAGSMGFAGGTGGSIPLALPSRLPNGDPLTVATTNATDLTPYNSVGSLRLVAPQVLDGAGNPIDVQIDPIAGAIENGPGGLYTGTGALYGEGSASIVAEGLEVFNLSPTGGVIDASVQQEVQNNAASFSGGLLLLDAFGDTTPVAGHTAAITGALAGGNPALASVLQVRPGAEIVNPNGNLTLANTWDFAAGATYTGDGNFNTAGGDPSLASNWDLSNMYYRFGPSLNEPGYLTLRASGNVEFGMDQNTGGPASLNDEFAGFDGADIYTLWQALMLPAASQSWSFTIVSGADFAAADARRVVPGTGSLLLGQGVPSLPSNPAANTDQAIIPSFYQTIRTGTGDIGIYAGGNVEILNNLATIYTAGTQTAPIPGFDLPNLEGNYPAQFSTDGGDVTIGAQGSIEHLTESGGEDSSKELPINWLYRQGSVNSNGQFASSQGSVQSTSWWTDYSNFFEGVGALGGGNVTLTAGDVIGNVDAAIPTDERTTYQVAVANSTAVDATAADQATLELGGGDLALSAAGDIDGGVYYVERGQGSLNAGDGILTNSTRATVSQSDAISFPKVAANPDSWLPTTLFLGQGSFSISAGSDVLLGPVANPFLLPEGVGNGIGDQTYFSTFATSDSVQVSSLAGTVTIKDDPDGSSGLGAGGGTGSLLDWLNLVLNTPNSTVTLSSKSESWLGLADSNMNLAPFSTVAGLMPSSLYATAFGGDVNLVGSLTLSPSPQGQVAVIAAGSINGTQPNVTNPANDSPEWGSSMVNLSDAAPASIPGVVTPSAVVNAAGNTPSTAALQTIDGLFDESGSLTGNYGVIQTKDGLHAPGPLHADDPNPVELYSETGDISGLTLFAGKSVQVVAGQDITDIALYVQNDEPNDISEVIAGGNITLYDPNSPLRIQAQTAGNQLLASGATSLPASGTPAAGDIQIGGPGTLEVLAGGNIGLGVGPEAPNGTSAGITSIGNTANPHLPFAGANIITAAGISGLGSLASAAPGLADSSVAYSNFIAQYVDPSTAGANAALYLPELAAMLGVNLPADSTPQEIWNALLAPAAGLSAGRQMQQQDRLALDVFYLVLRDAGRDFNDPSSPNYGDYAAGYAAIQMLLPDSPTAAGGANLAPAGSLSLSTRLLETTNGGDIDVFVPHGQVTVGLPTDAQKPNQGILTEDGGNISIFAQNDVDVGTSRIFTLHGGNVIIWSTLGSIAAGSGSKTVHAAPPTRVIIDPQSGDVQNDLAGLATGSGIGVLATLTDVAPDDVDLIAPVGTVNAGDAGIRASGNVSISALHVVNASNIQAGGTTSGVPVASAPNIGGLTAASSSSAASSSAANQMASQQQNAAQSQEVLVPSIITVEVLGYGGGDDVSDSTAKGEGTPG